MLRPRPQGCRRGEPAAASFPSAPASARPAPRPPVRPRKGGGSCAPARPAAGGRLRGRALAAARWQPGPWAKLATPSPALHLPSSVVRGGRAGRAPPEAREGPGAGRSGGSRGGWRFSLPAGARLALPSPPSHPLNPPPSAPDQRCNEEPRIKTGKGTASGSQNPAGFGRAPGLQPPARSSSSSSRLGVDYLQSAQTARKAEPLARSRRARPQSPSAPAPGTLC